MVGLTWRNDTPSAASAGATAGTTSWQVAVIVGTPRVGASVLVGEGRIAVGQTLTTDEGSRAKMAVSDIGQVTIDERTHVRLAETRDGHHRLALERGTLHAVITAPPGQFVVNTPSATATDLGCIYSLHVDEDGSGMLSVEAGWVAFEERGRESFVPSGASSGPIGSTVPALRATTTPSRRSAMRSTTSTAAATPRARPGRCASCSSTRAAATR